MKKISSLLLALFMIYVVNAETVDVTQDKKLNTGDEKITMAKLEQLVLQTVGERIIISPAPNGVFGTLPLKTQEDFREFICSIEPALVLLPADIQKLEKSLDKLGVSAGIKYYFLYLCFRQIGNERAGEIAERFFDKSVEACYPQAIFEWVEGVINSERCVENALKAANLLEQISHAEETKQVQLALARLTLLYPDVLLTNMTVENAIEFVCKHQEYISSLPSLDHNAFLEAAINCLVPNKGGKQLDQAIKLLTLFVHREERSIDSLIKLVYIFQKLNINQSQFVELCEQRIQTLSLKDHLFIASGYIGVDHLDGQKVVDRINKSSDMSKEFLKVALEAIEKSMQNKDLDLIAFFFGPKVEKGTEDNLPVPAV